MMSHDVSYSKLFQRRKSYTIQSISITSVNAIGIYSYLVGSAVVVDYDDFMNITIVVVPHSYLTNDL